MKKCNHCKGEGFVMIDETPEDCSMCDGSGEVSDLFEQMANLVKPYNKLILDIYSPFKF